MMNFHLTVNCDGCIGAIQLGYSRKKPNRGIEAYFFEKIPRIFGYFLFYSWKFQTNQSSTPGNSAKFYYIPWKFHSNKPRPLEIPLCF